MTIQQTIELAQSTIDQLKERPASESRDGWIAIGEQLLQLAEEIKEIKQGMTAQRRFTSFEDFIDTALL